MLEKRIRKRLIKTLDIPINGIFHFCEGAHLIGYTEPSKSLFEEKDLRCTCGRTTCFTISKQDVGKLLGKSSRLVDLARSQEKIQKDKKSYILPIFDLVYLGYKHVNIIELEKRQSNFLREKKETPRAV